MLIFIGMNQACASEVDANGDGISCLAFQLWEKAGCPEGRGLEFWMGAKTHLAPRQTPKAVKVDTLAPKPSSGQRDPSTSLHQHTINGAAQSKTQASPGPGNDMNRPTWVEVNGPLTCSRHVLTEPQPSGKTERKC